MSLLCLFMHRWKVLRVAPYYGCRIVHERCVRCERERSYFTRT